MDKYKRLIFRFLKYLKESPGSGFVLVFMILLIISAGFLICKNEDIAEKFANWGFSFLIIGVILKVIEFKRSYKNEKM